MPVNKLFLPIDSLVIGYIIIFASVIVSIPSPASNIKISFPLPPLKVSLSIPP